MSVKRRKKPGPKADRLVIHEHPADALDRLLGKAPAGKPSETKAVAPPRPPKK